MTDNLRKALEPFVAALDAKGRADDHPQSKPAWNTMEHYRDAAAAFAASPDLVAGVDRKAVARCIGTTLNWDDPSDEQSWEEDDYYRGKCLRQADAILSLLSQGGAVKA